MNRPKVAILLATFHPNHFLEEQIDTLRKQNGVDIKIFWGDDGSTKGEIVSVHEYMKDLEYEFFSFHNIGATRNFLELLKMANGYEYYAFCDQDDIWLPDKLITSISSLEGRTKPALAHSKVTVLKENKYQESKKICREHSMKYLVTENCFMGCTLIFNAKLRDMFLSFSSEGIAWHDWWIGWLAVCTGEIVTLDQPQTIYRIHPNNTIGLPSATKKLKRFLTRKSGVSVGQAILFRDRYINVIDQESLNAIDSWLRIYSGSSIQRVIALIRDNKRRSSFIDDLLRRISSTLKTP